MIIYNYLYGNKTYTSWLPQLLLHLGWEDKKYFATYITIEYTQKKSQNLVNPFRRCLDTNIVTWEFHILYIIFMIYESLKCNINILFWYTGNLSGMSSDGKWPRPPVNASNTRFPCTLDILCIYLHKKNISILSINVDVIVCTKFKARRHCQISEIFIFITLTDFWRPLLIRKIGGRGFRLSVISFTRFNAAKK